MKVITQVIRNKIMDMLYLVIAHILLMVIPLLVPARASGGSVTCVPIEIDRYGRTVALCKAGGKDLSCAMVAAGHAVERYGVLNCQ